MAEKIRTINLAHQMDIAVPDGLHLGVTGTVFLDGIDSQGSQYYQSAAIVSSAQPAPALGIVYYDGQTYQIQKAPQAPTGAWPLGQSITAACGVPGGLAAFASQDTGIPLVDVHHSPLSSGGPPSQSSDWTHSHTITFDQTTTGKGVTGTVRNMVEFQGKLYGFIKGNPPQSDVFFFYADALDNSIATVFSYTGNAAMAFMPLNTNEPNTMMQRRIAVYGSYTIYAIDETGASVLSADLNNYGVTSFPLSEDTTRGLVMHWDQNPAYNKAYTGYDPTAAGPVVPYAVNPDGSLTSASKKIGGGGAVCPSLDQTLGLLYLITPFPAAPVVDVQTNQGVKLTGDALPNIDNLAGIASTWVDSARGILYVSGVNGSPSGPKVPSAISVYQAK